MASARPLDKIRVEVIGGPDIGAGPVARQQSFANFTSLMIRNDITMPSEASFELGDDGTWTDLNQVFRPGVEFQVFVNETPRLRGRVEMNDVPLDVDAGAVVRFTVRTKLSDAMYASANQGTRVQGTSIREFIEELYKPLGFTSDSFVFAAYASRDIFTGLAKGETKPPTDLEKIKVDAARVKPPETIYAAADRHLRRHGLMHWDSPDGKIVVAAPDDEQDPIYTFNMFRGERSVRNNVLAATRTEDWSGIPSGVNVYGRGSKKGFNSRGVGGTANDLDVTASGFYRPLHIVAEGVRTNALAVSAARRELAARSKRKDAFSIEVDGFSFWDGSNFSPLYSPDTTAAIHTDVAGGEGGAYYLHAVTMTRDVESGDTSQLEVVRRGIWRLS